MQDLLTDIDAFLAAHGLSHWQFGLKALGDKRFVNELRDGRDIKASTERKVRQFMLTYRAEREAA